MAQQRLFVRILRVVQERAYIFFDNFAVLVRGAAAEALEALEALALSLSSTLGLTSLVVYKDVLTYNCSENGSKSVYEVALLYNRIPCYTLCRSQAEFAISMNGSKSVYKDVLLYKPDWAKSVACCTVTHGSRAHHKEWVVCWLFMPSRG